MLSNISGLQLTRVKQEAEETELALRDRIQRLEMTRLELEEEISRLKTTNMTDKIHAEEQIALTKQKVKSEEVLIFPCFVLDRVYSLNFSAQKSNTL